MPPWGEGAEFDARPWTLPRSPRPGRPARAAVHPLRHLAEAEGRRGARDGGRGARRVHRWRCSTGCAARVRRRPGRGSGSCYEVRWERLADYVKTRIEDEARKVADTPGGALLQIPQDTGSRGVAGRPRDVARDLLRRRRVPEGAPRGAARPGHGLRHRGRPRARRARRRRGRPGRRARAAPSSSTCRRRRTRCAPQSRSSGRAGCRPPSSCTRRWRSRLRSRCSRSRSRRRSARRAAPAPPAEPTPAEPPTPAEAPASTRGAESAVAPGRIPLEASDPLSLVEVADETGHVFEVVRAGAGLELPPGFYRIRHVGPESDRSTTSPGRARVGRDRSAAPARGHGALAGDGRLLAKAMGGTRGNGDTVELKGREPAAWAQTVDARGAWPSARRCRARRGAPCSTSARRGPPGGAGRGGGVAVYVVSERADSTRTRSSCVSGPRATDGAAQDRELRRADPRLGELHPAAASLVATGSRSQRKGEGRPMVFARHGAERDRMATVVVQLTTGIRLFQYQPALGDGDSTTPETLRHVEYLERMLLAGPARRRLRARPRARGGRRGRSVRRLPLRLRPAPARAAGRAREDRGDHHPDGAAALRRLHPAGRVRRRGRGERGEAVVRRGGRPPASRSLPRA